MTAPAAASRRPSGAVDWERLDLDHVLTEDNLQRLDRLADLVAGFIIKYESQPGPAAVPKTAAG